MVKNAKKYTFLCFDCIFEAMHLIKTYTYKTNMSSG